jgi:hypothetical protein
MVKSTLFFVISILFSSIILLVSGKLILMSEKKVNPSENYIVLDYGNLGDSKQASLACKYFSGRSILTKVFWYSPNNILGKDECPFILDRN